MKAIDIRKEHYSSAYPNFELIFTKIQEREPYASKQALFGCKLRNDG